MFSPDGELVVAAARSDDTQLLRVDVTGTARWNRSIANFGFAPDTLIPQADGSALFGNSADGDGSIGKVGADGHIVWLSRQPAVPDIVAIGPDRAAVVSCMNGTPARLVVTMRDTTTGAALWQNNSAFPDGPCSEHAVSDGQGNTYAFDGIHLLKYTATGTQAWNVSASGYLLGASTDLVYVATSVSVQARRTLDGSLAWTNPILVMPDSNTRPTRWLVADGELIVSASGAVMRLDNANGAPRWSTPVNGIVALAPSLINGRVAVASALSGLSITRVDAASGGASSPAYVTNDAVLKDVVAIGRFGANGIGVLARVGDDANVAQPRVYRVDATSGLPLTTLDLPLTPVAVTSAGSEDGGTDLVTAGEVVHAGGRRIVMRSVRASDGATLWQTNAAFIALPYFNSPAQVVLTPDLAVMSASSGDTYADPTYGNVFVQAFDRSLGTSRWIATLWTEQQVRAYVTAPQADAAGDIYVGLGVDLPCVGAPSQLCMRQTLYKLAAADGHIVWQRDAFEDWEAAQPIAYNFSIVGDSIVASGSFDAPADVSRIVGLSRSSGTPQWRTAALDPYGAVVGAAIDGSHFYAGHAGKVSRVATGSGTVEWSLDSPGCASPCYSYGNTVLPNGDTIGVGESVRAAMVTRMHADGSSVDVWKQTVPDADMRTYITSTKTDTSGNLWVRISQRWRYDGNGLQILARFDPISMTLQGQQVVSHQLLDATADFSIGWLERMSAGQALVTTWGRNGAVTGSGEALLDTHVVADGDIAVTVTSERRSVGAGGRVNFHAIVTYTGSAPISGAHLDLSFPAHQGLEGIGCSGQGVSQCVTDGSTSNLHASFDLTANGVADIYGSFKPLPNIESSHTGVQASVRGPIGLRETDTLNNMARAPIVIGLFADGFQ